MATYCGHSNAPVEYAMKERKKVGLTELSSVPPIPSIWKID